MRNYDIFGEPLEMTDEEMIQEWEEEAARADEAYAEMHQHCYGCEHYQAIGCCRDIDEFPECPRDVEKEGAEE